MLLPLYGFLQGDTLGLLLLVEEDETVRRPGEQAAAGGQRQGDGAKPGSRCGTKTGA